MNKVGFWTPVLGSDSRLAEWSERFFRLGSQVAYIEPCECHSGAVKGVELDTKTISHRWLAFRIGCCAGSILLSFHKSVSSKPLSHIRHLPAAALTFLFLAKVYHRWGTTYEVCDTSTRYETSSLNTCTLFEVIQGKNLDSNVINFAVENTGNVKLEQPKKYFSIEPDDMNICWFGALQDHYRKELSQEHSFVPIGPFIAMAAAYAVVHLTIIEMQALEQGDGSYWNYWNIIDDSLRVYSEIQLNHKDSGYKMSGASYTPRQIYNMLITALEPLQKPSNWPWKHDSLAVKKLSSQPASSAPVTIDSLIQLARSTKGIKFHSDDRCIASESMIMHSRHSPIDVLLGYSTYDGLWCNTFLSIRVHQPGFNQPHIIVFETLETDRKKWVHKSGPYLTLEEVKCLLETGYVQVGKNQWQLFE